MGVIGDLDVVRGALKLRGQAHESIITYDKARHNENTTIPDSRVSSNLAAN